MVYREKKKNWNVLLVEEHKLQDTLSSKKLCISYLDFYFMIKSLRTYLKEYTCSLVSHLHQVRELTQDRHPETCRFLVPIGRATGP